MSNDIDYTIHYHRYHDGSARNWQEMSRYFLASLSPYLPTDKNAEILDIGCGFGFGINGLNSIGYKSVLGIDSDAGQISMARSKGLNAEYIPVSATLDFLQNSPNRFSMIYAFDVLEHIPHDMQIPFLRGIVNALKPGSLLICRIPNALSPLGLYGRYIDWTHQCLFCRDSLEFMFANAGLKMLDLTKADDPQPDRSLLKQLIVAFIRVPLRVIVRGMWRLVLVSELGMELAKREPVTLNVIAVARKPA